MLQRRDQNAGDTRFDGTLNDGLAVFVKFIKIQVAVGIREHRLNDCENYNILGRNCHITKSPAVQQDFLSDLLFCIYTRELHSISQDCLYFVFMGGFAIDTHDWLGPTETN